MANDLGTSPGALIARRAIDNLLEEFPWITKITADFSEEEALFNQPISVKIPNALAAGDYSAVNGYVAQDVSQDDIPLTINKHKHVTYAFNDQERSSFNTLLVEQYARNAAHALGKAITDDLLALITAANFPNSTTMGTNGINDINGAKMGALRKKLNARKIPKAGRFTILNSDYYETLSNDETLITNAGSPSETVRNGELGFVRGFETHEYAQLPDNEENLAGIAGTAESLAIAVRVPTMPDPKKLNGGQVQIVVEPNTKFSIQLRTWYDWQAGKEIYTLTIIYGVAKGDTTRLERLVTEAAA